MVVLSSCSNRCARDMITMADVSVRDRLSVTQNMPLSCEFCAWITFEISSFRLKEAGNFFFFLYIYIYIYIYEISLMNKEYLAVFTHD